MGQMNEGLQEIAKRYQGAIRESVNTSVLFV